MKKYDVIIFDMDGTLIDTSEGIVNCHNEVGRLFGKKEIELNEYINKGIIGYPLKKGFQEHYDMNDEEVELAVVKYKELYSKNGVKQANIYEGIPELLNHLKNNGYKIALATLKIEDVAISMLKDNNIEQYFDCICGANINANYSKKDLLDNVINALNTKKDKVVLIGDSEFDAEGAKKADIDFIGVSYGLGYKSKNEIERGYHTGSASNVVELKKILLD